MNGPVLLLSLAITILTTLVCGLAPTLHVARSDLPAAAHRHGKGLGGSFRHGKLRAGLVITEVALSIVLLIGAGLLLRSFLVLTRVDLGFNPKNVLYIRPWFPRDQYKVRRKAERLYTSTSAAHEGLARRFLRFGVHVSAAPRPGIGAIPSSPENPTPSAGHEIRIV